MEKEKMIRDYYAIWERKDWDAMLGILDAGFTFTSPAPDDNINLEAFKKTCWDTQAEKIDRFDVDMIIANEDSAFARYKCHTKDGKIFRNTEYFHFVNDKIKDIDVFFGGGGGYPSNAK
jgi:ketosteroid isomerase-like protein